MNKVRQLSIFLENRAGRLAEACSLLGRNGINIKGFNIADSEGYGIFRIIVANTEMAKQVLKDGGFTVKESFVLCLDVPDKPGGLASVLGIFSQNGLNVEYMYMIANTKVAFSVEELDEAIKAFKDKNIKVLSDEEVMAL